MIQLQGDQRKDVQEFLVAKDGLELDAKTIKVSVLLACLFSSQPTDTVPGPWFLNASADILCYPARPSRTDRNCRPTRNLSLNDYFWPDRLRWSMQQPLTIAFSGYDKVMRL